MYKNFPLLILILIQVCITACKENIDKQEKQTTDKLPNILLIVADDMGFTDSSPYGGEMNTPSLQALADEGVRFSNFYAAPACSPSRSMMLTGVDNHLNGVGAMKEAIDILAKMKPEITEMLNGFPGYRGVLNKNVVTIPEVLNQKGYQNYITGKWHLGDKEDEFPTDRGFDKSYVILQGGSSHSGSPLKGLTPSDPIVFIENHKEIVPKEDFYTTRNFTDKMLEFIKKGDQNKPFFGYLAYTAPHDPLEVPEEYSNKYKGMYDEGYDVLRENRYKGLVEKGILKDGFPLAKKVAPDWNELTKEEKARRSRSYEVYAGMVDYMDEQIGRVVSHLKESGQYDNTLILFLSDNGSEWKNLTEYAPDSKEYVAANFDTSFENIGKPNSAESIGPGFAQACGSPFRGFKEKMSEGGIRMPFIVKWPNKNKDNLNGVNTEAILHITDIAPTIYNLVGVEYPEQFDGNSIEAISGKSMMPLLNEQSKEIRTGYLGFELHGAKAIRKGEWKLLWNTEDEFWELFNLNIDIGETKNLSKEHPQIFEEMKGHWDEYEKTYKVLPLKRPQF